jgi:hypothetical protein
LARQSLPLFDFHEDQFQKPGGEAAYKGRQPAEYQPSQKDTAKMTVAQLSSGGVGGLLACRLTAGNVDDREPVEALTQGIFGKLFGDKGYISRALFEKLFQRGLKLVTHIRNNMQSHLMEWEEKILLRKRSLIETVNDTLKNVCMIEHSRHRSPTNFLVHLLSGLITYTRLPKKPSIHMDRSECLNDLLSLCA